MLHVQFRRLQVLFPTGKRNVRPFSVSNTASALKPHQLPPRRKIDEDEIVENFLKGSGPGGQKINKTSSAVQLQHLPTGMVVKCQETRSREQNRKIARQLLAEKLDLAEKGDESRTALKTEILRRKKSSADRKKKRKYRKLEEEKQYETEEDETGPGDAKRHSDDQNKGSGKAEGT